MKKITILSVLTGFVMVLLTACGGGAPEKAQAPKEEKKKEAVVEETVSALETQMKAGEKIYKEKCVVCHQADGNGLKGAFPPLKDADYLVADPVRGIHQVLNGSNEEMVVNGEKYTAPMTPQVDSKEDAIAVVNYVLMKFNGFTEDKMLTIEDAADITVAPR
jgi:nitrite reductase (NO-forming)